MFTPLADYMLLYAGVATPYADFAMPDAAAIFFRAAFRCSMLRCRHISPRRLLTLMLLRHI